jgi:hypothetical protein
MPTNNVTKDITIVDTIITVIRAAGPRLKTVIPKKAGADPKILVAGLVERTTIGSDPK